MPKKRSSLKKARSVAFSRQKGSCYYCKKPMWQHDIERYAHEHGISLARARFFQCTGEHLVPHSEGGSSSQENIVAACQFCNQARHRAKKPADSHHYALHVKNRLEQGGWNSSLLCVR